MHAVCCGRVNVNVNGKRKRARAHFSTGIVSRIEVAIVDRARKRPRRSVGLKGAIIPLPKSGMITGNGTKLGMKALSCRDRLATRFEIKNSKMVRKKSRARWRAFSDRA